MALKFLSTHRIALTPLSPIHIGCGETFEPTNYVIDRERGFLYGFEPSDAVLTSAEMAALRSAVSSVDPYKINQYYASHVDVFRPWARTVMPIGANAERLYQKMLAPQGNQKKTQFEINRAIWAVRDGTIVPYVPGSSLKGAIVTALENRLNQNNAIGDRDNAKILLGGDFERSPMRLLRVGDCHGLSPRTRAFVCRRFFKDDHSPDSIVDTFESIVPAQYRAFTGEISLTPGQNPGDIHHVYDAPEAVLKDLHAYAYDRWLNEQGDFAHHAPQWTREMARLLKALSPLFESGRAALVRLGKNTGAESKTLHGLNQPNIEIRRKAKDPVTHKAKMDYLDHSTTAWFTDEAEEAFNGLPFGWAICELNPAGDVKPLEDWCEQMRDSWLHAHKGGSVSDEWDRVLVARKEKKAIREAQIAEAREAEVRRQSEADALAAKAAEMAAMSPERREATELCDALEAVNGSVNPGSELFTRTRALLEKALEWANAEDKMAFAVRLQPIMKKKNMFQGKAEKIFKKQLRTLKGEA